MFASGNGEQLHKIRYGGRYEGRKSGVDSNNKVWAIYKKVGVEDKKVGIMLIIRYGQYVKSGNNMWEKVRGKVKVVW